MTKRSEEHTRILRQKIVSSARLRGMSNNDIAALLIEKGVINQRTGEPWSIRMIEADARYVEEGWKEDMLSDISEHRARVLAEIRETKSAAWKTGKLSIVLRAIDQEVSLLGLNELERVGVEIALVNLFKGFPKDIGDELKRLLHKKVIDSKSSSGKGKLIPLKRARG